MQNFYVSDEADNTAGSSGLLGLFLSCGIVMTVAVIAAAPALIAHAFKQNPEKPVTPQHQMHIPVSPAPTPSR